MRKEKELAAKERLAPWNVDTIGQEAWSKSIINKGEKKSAPTPVVNEEEENKRMVIISWSFALILSYFSQSTLTKTRS